MHKPSSFMQNFYSFPSLLAVLLLIPGIGRTQVVYFHQDFSQTTSLVNPEPDTGQFSHVILTAPTLSYHKFHKGYMELVRTRQDSATGGIIRALRATPFTPGPETLVIRLRLSAESIGEAAQNAVYFYVGEDFNPVNNSFPGNALMFGKCSVSFLDDSFLIKDLETLLTSKSYPPKTSVTITWVLNNSAAPLSYRLTEPGREETAEPGTYDLWVNDEPVSKGSKAYPGSSAYSATKLSNFEIRFRNGIGKMRIDEILISDGKPTPQAQEVFVFPNPAMANVIVLSGSGVDAASVRLIDAGGRIIPTYAVPELPGRLKVMPSGPLASGIYLLQYQEWGGEVNAVKVLIE